MTSESERVRESDVVGDADDDEGGPMSNSQSREWVTEVRISS